MNIHHSIAIIIQARLRSTRFPGKILKKIYKNKSILDILIEQLKPLNYKLLIATTSKDSDYPIIKIAEKHQLDYFKGEEDDVLKRYISCAKKFNIKDIIRITSDNPFVQPSLIKPLILYNKDGLDYISYKIGEKNVVLTHWGLFGEYVSLSALEKVQKMTQDKRDREHVTYFIYHNPSEFNIQLWDVPTPLQREDIRLTIDWEDDFHVCKEILEYLIENHLPWTYKIILEYIEKNEMIYNQIQENIKKNRN